MKKILHYIHDPMCSWCWGFRPAWESIRAGLVAIDSSIEVGYVLGGLAPDSNEPMPLETQRYVRDNWQRIQQVIPGTVFNDAFWETCQPRRSTYPACRAVIAATQQGEVHQEPMILAIQQAYYLHAKNPSNEDVLSECAQAIGLDMNVFIATLNSQCAQRELEDNIAYYHYLRQCSGVSGFPSLVLEVGDRLLAVPVDYNNPTISLDFIRLAL
jgi:putative protein-disulfide isomerase